MPWLLGRALGVLSAAMLWLLGRTLGVLSAAVPWLLGRALGVLSAALSLSPAGVPTIGGTVGLRAIIASMAVAGTGRHRPAQAGAQRPPLRFCNVQS